MVSESVDAHWVNDPAVMIGLYRVTTKLERPRRRQFEEHLPALGFKVFARRIPLAAAVVRAQMDGASL
ncbi:hypothetical protein Corgl_0919 [Coriobacterium glomerans PW2]|uniref:Uncharacterized protein n=1 Tax=Coriobacterium glomerans (strain ATCC 49209 / DSM 20642 / JCM 10262 / PW2) TaxID=700015 RepID=F2N9K1_CORGP|nr:hypothetical protein [Coriobacterium glomerans]AEB07030.1 hypothetical protein Corgl_0919 [Coriobacterium glomerans PW2]